MLQVLGLEKRFGRVAVADKIDLSIDQGEIRCLIGPNGAGKSSLLGLLSGKLMPTAGSIVFNGRNMTKWPTFKRMRHGLGIKFQIPSVFPSLTVLENLEVAAGRSADAGDVAARQALIKIGLVERADAPAQTLSHGQKQRLEIGLAIVQRPALLLLDEPSAGMTPSETIETGELLKRINAEGVTILAVEHDMAFVKHIASAVTVMNLGRIFAHGSFDQISQNADVIDIYLGRA